MGRLENILFHTQYTHACLVYTVWKTYLTRSSIDNHSGMLLLLLLDGSSDGMLLLEGIIDNHSGMLLLLDGSSDGTLLLEPVTRLSFARAPQYELVIMWLPESLHGKNTS